MKIKYLVPILFIVFIFSFTACTVPKTAAETTVTETTIATEIITTTDTTTAVAPGSANEQGYQLMEMRDGQGRLIMKNLGDGRYRFYAWEDGYDVNVGNGFLLLKAGNSYTFEWSFEWSAEHGNPQQAEVRLISNDQLVGYALLIMNYDSNGAFTGLEKPIAIADSNGDGLVSIQELNTALAGLREEVTLIAKSQPSLGTRLEADITSAYAMGNSGAIADSYQKIKQIQLDVLQAAKEQAAKNQKNVVYLSIAMAAVILFLVAFLLVRRRKSKMLKRNM